VLFNFPSAKALVVSNLSFQGSILAPSAAVTYNNGNVEGSIACASYQGNGEFHNYPYIPPETTCICPPCDSFINVPSSKFYSLFIFENIDSDSTDFEGRVAVGGDATFRFVGIGDKLTPSSGDRADLQVSGDLFYHDGEVFNGNIVVEGSYDVERVGTPHGSLLNEAVNIPWHIDFLGLHAISIFLSGWYPNGAATVMYSTLNLYGEDFYLNTFNIDSATLGNARTIVVSVPVESHVLIKVNGGNAPVHFENSGIVLDGAHSSRILWNFYNTHLLEMKSIQIEGSVLAPVTDVVFNNGQLKGAIFAHSYTGHGEIHLSPWVPLPVPCPPCDC
jgi:choice-of-anchor A domain-containing protein